MKTAVGPEYGQRDAGKSAPGPHVEYGCAGDRSHELADRERMKYMAFIEIVDVFARDNVYFFIPFRIELSQNLKLFFLSG